jgi:hypothetical protein
MIVRDWSEGALGSLSFPDELEQLVKGVPAKK